MAKLDNVRIKIKKALSDLVNPTYMEQIGKFAADMIRVRTQLGYGVAGDGEARTRLKPLAESTVAQRKRSQLNENTSPTKSNLTRTGQLLSSLTVAKVSGSTVVIGPRGERTDGKTNEDVGGYVSQQGRPFTHLSDVERKRVTEQIRKDLQAQLEESLAKIRS